MASIKVTYLVALHCQYTLGKELSLILSCLTPQCNMQWPNGKSVLEILLSYLTPGHTECGGLSGFFEVAGLQQTFRAGWPPIFKF